MSEILIEPCVKVVEKSIDKCVISVVGLTLGISCVVRAECKKGDDYPELINTFLLEGDDYLAWTNDDSYIVNYVLNKLGLTKREEVVVVPPNTPDLVLESVEII